MTTEQHFRGGWSVWLQLLNKIIGCKSRTVPPLCALKRSKMVKTGHWKKFREGFWSVAEGKQPLPQA